MGWTELRERGGKSEMSLRHKVMEVKSLICEICEDIDKMDERGYGERGRERERMPMEYGERRGYRIYEDDEDYKERRRY